MKDIKEIIRYSSNLNLLYVEDNESARESTLAILEELFNTIIVAVDGLDGYEKFKNNSIDIIITDINMPKLNGLKMIEKIREIDKDIFILVLSAYNESDFFTQSIKLGVEGYILKPIGMEQFFGVLEKIIEKVVLQEQINKNISLLKQYQEATDKSSVVSKTDIKGIITYVNDEFCTISEYSREELLGKNHNIIRHSDNPKNIYEELWETIQIRKKIWKGTIRNISKNGKIYYVKTTIKPILDIDGEILEYIALTDNITDIMSPLKQLNDFLSFSKNPVLCLLEIVEYRNLEKFYGYPKIEEIQQKISTKILEFMPENCFFEKIFILADGKYGLVQDYNGIDKDKVTSTAKAMLDSMNSSNFQIDDATYDISIRMSIAYGKNIFDNCMYGLKELYQVGHNFIVADNLATLEQKKAHKNLNTLEMVNTAIKNLKIVSYFQPIVDNKTEKTVKYESLVRLINEDDIVLAPIFFLDIAKEGRFYSQITKIVLKNSFAALYKTDKEISINLSALDIEKQSISDVILNLLEEHKVVASRVVFELLEDENVRNIEIVNEFITKVKKYGVKIAIDDFGSGYSNFERLLNYQPDILKIDASLIKNILTNDYSLSVVKTIISFAKSQNLQIIAEYVESREIYELLRNLDVDFSQGYYFGKPEPLEEQGE